MAARPPRAMAVVSGRPLGQTFTQFCALPQTWMPPSAVKASSRSPAFIAPMGFMLNRSTWAMAWAPMNERSTASRSRARNCSWRLVGLLEQFHLQELRAGLQAAAATHALAVLVGELLLLLRLPRAGAHVVVAVDRHPGLDLLQRGEEPRTVDHQVADDGKLGHRPQLDAVGLVFEQVVDQGRAGLPHAAVDDHRTRPADLFQAVALPDHRRDVPPVGGDRRFGDLLQGRDHVHVGLVLDVELVPVAWLARQILAKDTDGESAREVAGMIGGQVEIDVNPNMIESANRTNSRLSLIVRIRSFDSDFTSSAACRSFHTCSITSPPARPYSRGRGGIRLVLTSS